MKYSDTSTKDGLLQDIETWIGLGDGSVSGNSTLKSVFTGLINRYLDKANGLMGQQSRLSQFDDVSYDNQPFSLFNIASGVNDYQFLTDEDGNTITDITAVLIQPGDDQTNFVKLKKLTLDEKDAELIMSPNSDNTGIPTGFIERNNTVFFDRIPNFSKTGGGKLFYKRVPSYFTTSDTTKEANLPGQNDRYLSVSSAHNWIVVNRPDKVSLITRLEAEIKYYEDAFKAFALMKNPTRNRISPLISSSE